MPRFDFYLLNVSFQTPPDSTIEELGEKIEHLAIDCDNIRVQGENIFCHPEIYDTRMFGSYTFIDIVYDRKIALTRDQINALQVIIDRSKPTELDNDFIIELLVLENPEEINALLCLFKVLDNRIPIECLIYSFRDWLQFHRDYFVKCPPPRASFCEALAPWFSNLFLNSSTIHSGLRGLHSNHEDIMRSIIHHLSALNDVYHPFFLANRHVGGDGACDYLENYFRSHEVRIGASREKNNIPELVFQFNDPQTGDTLNCYCDLHTKFYQYYEYADPTYHAKGNRIYFHQPIEGFLGEKLLVARIGKHA